MSLKEILPKNWLPKGWEEISREGTEMQILINIGHFNPEDKADPRLVSGSPVTEINGEAYTVHSAQTRGSMKKFFEVMTKNAELGFMKGYTPEKIQDIRKQFNSGIQNEKYDTTTAISISKYPDEQSAKAALDQQLSIHTEGFNFKQFTDNPALKAVLPKDQLAKLEEFAAKTKDLKMPKMTLDKIKYFMGTYLGQPAVLSEMENPDYERFMAPKPVVKRDPNKFQGGGFDPLAGKGVLPERPKPVAPPKVFVFCLAIQVENFLVTGSLLYTVPMLPQGNTFCESLTKSKTYVETEKVEGKTYTNKYLVPIASNYSSEGYFNKEQGEEMLKSIIESVKNFKD